MSDYNLYGSVEAFFNDGFVVFENAVCDDLIGCLNQRMLEDTERLMAGDGLSHYAEVWPGIALCSPNLNSPTHPFAITQNVCPCDCGPENGMTELWLGTQNTGRGGSASAGGSLSSRSPSWKRGGRFGLRYIYASQPPWINDM